MLSCFSSTLANENYQCVPNDFKRERRMIFSPMHPNHFRGSGSRSTAQAMAPTGGGVPNRRDEIRRKIQRLKKDGKIKNKETKSDINKATPVVDQYADKVKEKLGKRGGYGNVGTLDEIYASSSGSKTAATVPLTDYLLEENDDDDDDDDDQSLVEKVQKKLMEKRRREAAADLKETTLGGKLDMDDLANKMEREKNQQLQQAKIKEAGQMSNNDSSPTAQLTTGIGGSWAKNETSEVDTYRPANGGWGYFPRPKDISKAYGGGKRIGADISSSAEEERIRARQWDETKEKLRQYKKKVGIDVQSEKDNAEEIEEALAIAQRGMQRGIYNVAVSALEKVTKYCSTNSKVGGKVFLELAMAYEAVGKTEEARSIYSALCDSRNEEVQSNAKRLIVGIEAMQFMRDEVKDENFSRKSASQTFIDTTGFGNMRQNFDKVYNTGYIDLDRGGAYYRKLTENVVRSIREARQILLKATNSGEVDRRKVVQALRSINRSFDNALEEEIEENALKDEPVAVMNGVPIAKQKKKGRSSAGMDTFNLGSANAMKDNLRGEWKLQLMADRKGDGVSYYNKTISWQTVWQDSESSPMNYRLSLPAAFLTVSQRGQFEFADERRILSRCALKSEGSGAFFTDFMGKSSGPVVVTNAAQQVISVDSELLITRLAASKGKLYENAKEYYSVWRRVEPGLFSSSKQ